MNDTIDKYVTCEKCGYIQSWVPHGHLICAMPCPDCGEKDQFGPGIYVEDYAGISLTEAMERRRERVERSLTAAKRQAGLG